jgi:hypothetical protein
MNNKNNYEIRVKLTNKFTKEKAFNVIKYILDEKMSLMNENYNEELAQQLNREICETIRNEFKDGKYNFQKYKFIVHCIIGEKKGQGIKIGSKCIWDSNSDSVVCVNWANENIFAFCSVYGIYFY